MYDQQRGDDPLSATANGYNAARMTKVPSDAVDHTPMQAPPGPPPVVVVKSVAGSTYFSYSLGLVAATRVLVLGVIVTFLLVLVLSYLQGGGRSAALWAVLGCNLSIIAIMSGTMLVRRTRTWRADRVAHEAERATADVHDPSWIVRGALLEIGGLCRVNWLTTRVKPEYRNRFQSMLQEAGLPQSMVIVQAELIDDLQRIRIDDSFVEPERLLGAMPRRSAAFWVHAALTLYLLWLLLNSVLRKEWIMTAVFALAFTGMAAQLLKTYDIHISQANAPVMGLGAYSDHKGRRWTVCDSVVYLYPFRAGFQTSILASIIGPDGYTAVHFHDLKDPALTMFWQRWMHPHPRPDLV